MPSLDLEQHLVKYGAYHHNKVNVAIHIICVPLILFSGFCLGTYTGTLVHLPPWLSLRYMDINLGVIASILWASIYLLLEPVAGFLLASICLAVAAGSNYLREQNPQSTWTAALVIHIGCWLAQFIGHGVFEKRAPALFDNLLQAIFLAPMFVWLEVLFFLGYRPELQSRVHTKVQVEIAKFRMKNNKSVKDN